jgi:Tfp pilus assembly protein PilN
MSVVAGQILFCLLLAALIGVAIGWLLTSIFVGNARNSNAADDGGTLRTEIAKRDARINELETALASKTASETRREEIKRTAPQTTSRRKKPGRSQ